MRYNFSIKRKELYIYIFTFLLIFQSAMERVSSFFSYVDEVIALIGFAFVVVYVGNTKKNFKKRKNQIVIFFVFLFLLAGLVGNFIYKYQPFKLVLQDLYTNIKFYLAILMGYYCSRNISLSEMEKASSGAARIALIIIFTTFVIDRIFNIYEGGVRYGIKAAEIFYSGTTYFAASLIFIITILTAFYRKRNTIYIAASLLMLVMTLRSKAFGAALCYMCLVFFIFKIRKKIKIWHIAAFGIFVIAVAWNNIYFYYVLLAGKSARSVMTLTSLQILKDYFPIGTGFGTYASHAAAVSYSPVYVMYGFQDIWELSNQNVDAFFDDTFWPIIIAQTGFIGIISYLIVLWNVIKKCFNLWEINRYFYAAALFVIAYLLISSIGEPAFNNSISIPLAVSLGVIFRISATNREDYQRLAEVNVSV